MQSKPTLSTSKVSKPKGFYSGRAAEEVKSATSSAKSTYGTKKVEDTKKIQCKFYFERGHCRYGDKCRYSHKLLMKVPEAKPIRKEEVAKACLKTSLPEKSCAPKDWSEL